MGDSSNFNNFPGDSPPLIDLPRELTDCLSLHASESEPHHLQCRPFPFYSHICTMRSALRTAARGRFQFSDVHIPTSSHRAAVLPSKLTLWVEESHSSFQRDLPCFVVIPVV